MEDTTMMGHKGREKCASEHPVVCRKCRRMVGTKYRAKPNKQRLNRQTRRAAKVATGYLVLENMDRWYIW